MHPSDHHVEQIVEQYMTDLQNRIGYGYGYGSQDSAIFYHIRDTIADYLRSLIREQERMREEINWIRAIIPIQPYQNLNHNITRVLHEMNVTIEQFSQIDFSDKDLQETLKNHITMALLKK